MSEQGMKRLPKLHTLEGVVERHSRIADLLAIAYSCIEQAKCLIPVVPAEKPGQVITADQIAMQLAETADNVHEVLTAAQNVVNKNIR